MLEMRLFYPIVSLAIVGIAATAHVDWRNERHWNDPSSSQQRQFSNNNYNYNQIQSSDRPQQDNWNFQVDKNIPPHRILLKGLYRQILGPNFTSPGLKTLAFLSTTSADNEPSLPLQMLEDNSSEGYHIERPSIPFEYENQTPAETQFDIPQYIRPPASNNGYDYNYGYLDRP